MAITKIQSLKYGLTGLLVSSTSLPLYIVVPTIYTTTYGLSLAKVGIALMLVRLMDAITDPLVGRLIDKTGSSNKFKVWITPSAIVMTVSYLALINPPDNLQSNFQVLLYMAAFTLVVSTTAGILSIALQAWPMQWTEAISEQSELISRREQLTFIGVIIAATLSTTNDTVVFSGYLLVVTLIAILSILSLPPILKSPLPSKILGWHPAKSMAGLMLPLFISSLSNAAAGTLFMFFVVDHLGLSQGSGGGLLAIYFTSAFVGVWAWQRVSNNYSTVNLYMLVLLLTIATFIPGFGIDETNASSFIVICVLTGFLVGGELLLSSILMIKKIKSIDQIAHSGIIFGSWGLFIKLGLALAAGTVLPLLAYLGYQPEITPKHPSLPLVYLASPIILKFISLILITLHKYNYGHIYSAKKNILITRMH